MQLTPQLVRHHTEGVAELQRGTRFCHIETAGHQPLRVGLAAAIAVAMKSVGTV